MTDTSTSNDRQPRRPMGPLVRIAVALVLLLAVGVWLWLDSGGLSLGLSAGRITGFVTRLGYWAWVGGVAVMVVHAVLPFPAELAAAANGMVFGPLLGFALTWGGAMIGAVLTYWVARRWGRGPALRLLGSDRSARLDAWIGVRGWRALLIARLLPVVSFNVLNVAAGLAGIGWFAFLWTTAVGIVPLTLLAVAIGGGMLNPAWRPFVLVGVAVLAAGLGLWWWWRRDRPAQDPS